MAAYANSMVAKLWKMQWDHKQVDGLIGVVFWRPIEMEHPLKHMPLTVCDKNTVRVEDVFTTHVMGFAPNKKVIPRQ